MAALSGNKRTYIISIVTSNAPSYGGSLGPFNAQLEHLRGPRVTRRLCVCVRVKSRWNGLPYYCTSMGVRSSLVPSLSLLRAIILRMTFDPTRKVGTRLVPRFANIVSICIHCHVQSSSVTKKRPHVFFTLSINMHACSM